MISPNEKVDLYIHFENSIIEVINNLNKKQDYSIVYEDILVVYFECIIIGFCEKAQICPQNMDSYITRYKTGRTTLRGKLRDLKTNIFGNSNSEDQILSIMVNTFFNSFEYIQKTFTFDVTDMGILFEEFFNKALNTDTNNLDNTTARKDAGMFFSDANLVRFIIRKIVGKNKNRIREKNIRFLDPSMGAGIFIYALVEAIEDDIKGINASDYKEIITKCLYGVDKNPLLVDIFKICLWIKTIKYGIEFEEINKNFIVADSLLLNIGDNNGQFESWIDIFPEAIMSGGFDCVVGNPPWGRIKANIREFNILKNNLSESYQGALLKEKFSARKEYKEWEEYKKYIDGYSARLKESLNYRHQRYEIDGSITGGDADLYRYFLEQSYNLLTSSGTLGFIIPASFYLSESATGLRHLYLENGTIEYLINYENKKSIFPIHPSFKFIIMIYNKNCRAGNIKNAIFNLTDTDDLVDQNKFNKLNFISYSRAFLDKCSKNYWSVPECSSVLEQKTLLKIYESFPLLSSKKTDNWSVSFNREIDMTNNSGNFVTKKQLKVKSNDSNKPYVIIDGQKYIPIYEGRMVHQYNSSRKTYLSGNGRTAKWEINSQNNKGIITPHYYINSNVKSNLNNYNIYRAGYCDVTGQKNVRTILASLIPPETACGNKVPTCTFYEDNSIIYHLYWIGVANSFVVDWVMRKKMTTTLNFFHWGQIPFPRIDIRGKTARTIIMCAAAITELTNGFELFHLLREGFSDIELQEYCSIKLKKIYELRAIIDCEVAELFKLSLEELALIMMGFPSLDSKQVGIEGDLRYLSKRKTSYVTRDYLINLYMCRKGLDSHISIIDLYNKIGIDISPNTGKINMLDERITFYKENGIIPYDE